MRSQPILEEGESALKGKKLSALSVSRYQVRGENRMIIRDENYYVISAWMNRVLGLTGQKLSVFAIVYSFSQNGTSEFHGSLQYLSDFTGINKRSNVLRVLTSLVKEGYLKRREELNNGVKTVFYSVNFEKIDALKRCTQNEYRGCPQNEYGGVLKMSTNIKDDNKDDNKEDNKQESKKEKLNKLFLSHKGFQNEKRYIEAMELYENEILPLQSFDEIIDFYTEDKSVRKYLREWLKVLKSKGAVMTNTSIYMNLCKLTDAACFSDMSIAGYLMEVIARGWTSFYPISDRKVEVST